jgi:Zn-dependent protease
MHVNVGLAIFNLLPFPPLDGARLLPRMFDPLVRPLER